METTPVINLTKFKTTGELAAFGVCDLSSWREFKEVRQLLFFALLPNKDTVRMRVARLVDIACSEARKTGASTVLVGCPPWMMYPLCAELVLHRLTPLVCFTKITSDGCLAVIDLVMAA